MWSARHTECWSVYRTVGERLILKFTWHKQLQGFTWPSKAGSPLQSTKQGTISECGILLTKVLNCFCEVYFYHLYIHIAYVTIMIISGGLECFFLRFVAFNILNILSSCTQNVSCIWFSFFFIIFISINQVNKYRCFLCWINIKND